MTSVTGMMAGRMKDIEDASIVSGSVVGDNLILINRKGEALDAGSVRGARGLPGAQGVKGDPGGSEVITRKFAIAPGTMIRRTHPGVGYSVPFGDQMISFQTLFPSSLSPAVNRALNTTSFLVSCIVAPDYQTSTWSMPGRISTGSNGQNCEFKHVVQMGGWDVLRSAKFGLVFGPFYDSYGTVDTSTTTIPLAQGLDVYISIAFQA